MKLHAKGGGILLIASVILAIKGMYKLILLKSYYIFIAFLSYLIVIPLLFYRYLFSDIDGEFLNYIRSFPEIVSILIFSLIAVFGIVFLFSGFYINKFVKNLEVKKQQLNIKGK